MQKFDLKTFLPVEKILPSFSHAVRFLTILPFGDDDENNIDNTLFLFFIPIVGLLLGLILLIFLKLTNQLFPVSVASLLTVIAYVFLTRKLHLDGVSDSFDGLLGGQNKEEALRIMKDPHAGSFGVIGLILVLFAFWSGVDSLLGQARLAPIGLGVLVAAPCVARWAMLFAGTGATPVNPEGLGKWFIGLQSQKALWIASVIPLLILIGVLSGYGLVLFGGVMAVAWAIRQWATNKIGGLNGDIFGLVLEVTQVFVLIGGCVVLQ